MAGGQAQSAALAAGMAGGCSRSECVGRSDGPAAGVACGLVPVCVAAGHRQWAADEGHQRWPGAVKSGMSEREAEFGGE